MRSPASSSTPSGRTSTKEFPWRTVMRTAARGGSFTLSRTRTVVSAKAVRSPSERMSRKPSSSSWTTAGAVKVAASASSASIRTGQPPSTAHPEICCQRTLSTPLPT